MGDYCPSCMKENAEGAAVCAFCGGDMNLKNRQHQLSTMTILDGRYLVGKVLGEGGFGITYVGLDLRLNEKVAIKEFYPAGNVTRYSEHSIRVEATCAEAELVLDREREKFRSEVEAMTRFNKESNIVHVRDFFLENSTSYIVMEYVDGKTLSALLKENGPEKDFNKLYTQLKPMMKSLNEVHKSGLIHRDISPSNLMLDKDGEVKLLDFGTARELSTEGEKSLSIVLKPGFAPEEQYRRHGKQGPWTDVYALCATMYKLCTGITPEVSVDRLTEDTLVPPSKLGVTISRAQENALMHGLAIRQEDRTQTVGALIAELDNATKDSPQKKAETNTAPKNAAQKSTAIKDTHPKGKSKKKNIIIAAVAAVVVIAVLLLAVIPSISNSTKYNDALALMKEGKVIEAYESFDSLGSYKDSAEKAESIYDEYTMAVMLQNADVGDVIKFGTYEQDNDDSDGSETIEWQVLAAEEDKILVISKYALDTLPYNTKSTNITWEKSSLRSWLNEDFFNEAFNEVETKFLLTTDVSAEQNPDYKTKAGNSTDDIVFLLSISEANEYFESDKDRQCLPTDYAAQKAYLEKGNDNCWWWLRSAGSEQNMAANVRNSGNINTNGTKANNSGDCIRPAMWLSLDF